MNDFKQMMRAKRRRAEMMKESEREKIKRTHKKGWRDKGKEAAKYSPIPWRRQRIETETDTDRERAAPAWYWAGVHAEYAAAW